MMLIQPFRNLLQFFQVEETILVLVEVIEMGSTSP